MSSAANPVVYALGSKKFRNAVRRLWRKRKIIRQKTLQTQTKVQDAGQNVVSLHNKAKRLMRSKSVPIDSTKTDQKTETDMNIIPRNNIPPIIVLSPLEEVTTPKMSLSSGVSNMECKLDPVNRLSPSGHGPSSSWMSRAPRRLPPLKGGKKVQKNSNNIEMTEMTKSPSNPLQCLDIVTNGALPIRRSSSPKW